MNALGKGILKDVSRSFYLSMRVLPRGMREPISLGYLLARASDTLADTPGLEASLRAEMLDGFRGVLAGGERGAWLAQLRRDVIPRQRHAGEKSLLENMEGVFAWLDSLLRQQGVGEYGARQHAAIMTVMGHILTGQRLDIERFELRQGFRFSDDGLSSGRGSVFPMMRSLRNTATWWPGVSGSSGRRLAGFPRGNFPRRMLPR